MKKIYNEEHVKYMKLFIQNHLAQIIRKDINFEAQAKKHVEYLDRAELGQLITFFNIDKLTELELMTYLSKIGFFSKITIYEKRAIFTDYTRNYLIRAITYNDALIDYDRLKKAKKFSFSNILIRAVKLFRKRIQKRMKALMEWGPGKYDPEYLKDPSKPLYLDPLDEKSLNRFFTPTSLRFVPFENIPQPSLNPPTEITILVAENTKPTLRKITIYDRIDDPNIILRRKKSLYLDKSTPIDYHSKDKIEYNNINEKVDQLPDYEFEDSIYEGFNLKDFINKTLFINNGITVPKTSNYTSFTEFRTAMKGNVYFLRNCLTVYIKDLLLSQDEYLSNTDANFLAVEYKRHLSLPAVEYFYKLYVESDEFRKVSIERVSEQRKKAAERIKKDLQE